MRAGRAIHVEVLIRAPMDEVWRLTQDPRLHPRWDVRFSRITPEDAVPGQAQRFAYERSLPGHVIRGAGISLGEKRRPDGTRTSALRFTTRDRLSPLQDGRGFWRYIPTEDGIRFVTGYDYRPGFGRLPDVLIRPLVGWLTAWSFDRLRIWAERGEEPERWPPAAVLMVWRPDRPRASRCGRRPPSGGAMSQSPATLSSLEAP